MDVGRVWRIVGVQAAGLLLLVVGLTSPTSAAPASGSLAGTPAGPVVAGESVTLAGALAPAQARPVTLQSRVGAASWTPVVSKRSRSDGRFRFGTRVRGAAGQTVRFRVVAPAVRIGGHALPARHTPTVTYRVVTPASTLTATRLVVEGGTLTAEAAFTPARPGRPVTLEAWDGAGWTVLTAGVEDGTGAVTFSPTAPPAGMLRLRAEAARRSGAAPVASPEAVVFVQPGLGPGQHHSCQVRVDGTAWCWGWGLLGQLGDSGTADQDQPVQVPGSGWVRMAGGATHSCGLKSDGTLWCWGDNGMGQLGDGTRDDSPEAVQVAGDWVGLGVGDNHSCGVRGDGTLWCWGFNVMGQLGDGSVKDRLTPVQVGTAADWVGVDGAAFDTCGVRADGSGWCWGYNGAGRLGDGTTQERHEPTQVTGPAAWTQITVGGSNTCGVRTDGTAWCWGPNNAGQLGTGSDPLDQRAPVQVGTATDWLRLDAAGTSTCGVREDGSAWCWSDNARGQLGTGTRDPSTVPVQVLGTGWTPQLAAGAGHVCAVDLAGTTWCWGRNDYGQVGDGTHGADQDRPSPTEVGWP